MLTLGALMVCGAVLAFAALTLVFRRPEPPSWTTRSSVSELVTIALVSMLTFGIGYLAAGAIRLYGQGVEPLDLGLFVAVLAGALVVWRRLDVRARLRLIERPVVVAGPPAQVVPLVADGGAARATPAGPLPAYPAGRAA